MLSKLFIKNYALIQSLEISLTKGLNIITGETGAGKSILLGALGLLMGNRADSKSLYDENEKCIVEGEFDISSYNLNDLFKQEDLDYEQVCTIRREISSGGKSRAFINDTPVNLDTLKSISGRLIDIHSQHDTIMLGSSNYQLDIIDILCDNLALKRDFIEAYKRYKRSEQEYRELVENSISLKREYDFDKFLFEELEKAELVADEQELLEADLNINENAEEVKIKLSEISFLLNNADQSILSNIYTVSTLINGLSKFSEKFQDLKNRIDSSLIELKDITSEIENEAESVFYDPLKIENIKERLSLIYTLQKKHSVSQISDLIKIQSDLHSKLEKVQNLEEEIAESQKRKEESLSKAMALAESLSGNRKQISDELEKTLIDLLKSLGMPNASVKVSHSANTLDATGIDDMKILFSANKGMAPQELRSVASGGEFSRLMLSLKYMIASKIALPTIIFDEIDTGVSGEISIKMSKMMKEMAKNHQVFAITHLPQIASQGESQFFVYKDDSSVRTVSKIRQLSEQERIVEIAKMIGGEKPSAIAISNAKELLGVD